LLERSLESNSRGNEIMITFKTILCPVDSSEFSVRALRYAAELASWYDAELVALSVSSELMPALPLTSAEASFLEDPHRGRNPDDALRTFVSDAGVSSAVRLMTADGPIVQEILRIAVELPADLIVMGTHGVSGFERLLLGSVTEKVLRKAPCPVLTVPRLATADAAHAPTFKTIVCAFDFSEASKRGLECALSLAQEAGGRLLLLHALEGLAEVQSPLTAYFDVEEVRRALARDTQAELEALVPDDARAWCEAEVIVGQGKPYREVLRVAGERHADLIVLGVQGRGALDLTLFGSTTQHVVRSATCPVLTVGPAKRGQA
jgi:nucleotide-binding universal stress UspA family protein